MFICFFALWVVLNGKWTTEIGVFGLVFASLAYAFVWKYMGYSPKVDLALVRRVPSAISYGVTLVVEIIKANLTVCSMILKGEFEPKPQLVQFDVDLAKDRHRVALANSITLTPGTITVSLDGAHYIVHCLDQSMVDGLDNGVMPSMLVDMEKRHLAADSRSAAAKQAEEEAAETATAEMPSEEAEEAAHCEAQAAEAADEGEEKGDEHEH